MRTETITRTIYKFDELPEKVKEKAIYKLWDLNVDHKWWDAIYEDAENIGLKINGFDLEGGNYCNGEFITTAPECAQKITEEHGECSATFATAKNYLKKLDTLDSKYPYENIDDRPAEYDDDREELDKEFLKALCKYYLSSLKEDYNYLTSKECITETIISNDYEFNENGELA